MRFELTAKHVCAWATVPAKIEHAVCKGGSPTTVAHTPRGVNVELFSRRK